MFQIAHAGAAVLLLDRDAEHAEIAELAPQIHRELVVAIDRRGERRDLVGGKTLHRAAQHVRCLAEVEVQAWKPV